jgi:hypothetical protein
VPTPTVAPPDLPPAAGVDTAAIRAAASALTPLGQPVADLGDAAIRAWRHIGDYYIARETPVLIAALDPIGPLTEKSGERVRGLGAALATFADAAEPIIAELRRLGGGGPVTPEDAARMTALIEELAAVERDCATAIRALTGSSLAPDRFKVGEEVAKGAFAITVGPVKIGQSATFKETVFSDGSVLLTAQDGAELTGKGALGPIEAGGGVKIEAGSTWKFASQDEADAFKARLSQYLIAQHAVMFEEGAALGVAAAGGLTPIRPPDMVISEFAAPVSAKVSGDTGVLAGDGKAEVTPKVTVLRDMATGSTTTTYSQEGYVEANGTVTPFAVGPGVGGGFQKLAGSTTGITEDANGRITKVILTSTDSAQGTFSEPVAGPGKDPSPPKHAAPGVDPSGKIIDKSKATDLTLTTTTLDVTDENRAAVERWVAGGRRDAGGLTGDIRQHYPVASTPGDDFQNALHDKAKVTRVTYDDVTDVDGFEAKIKAGWSLGIEGSVEHTSSHEAEGTYLDAPGPDDVRREVPIPPR